MLYPCKYFVSEMQSFDRITVKILVYRSYVSLMHEMNVFHTDTKATPQGRQN